MGTFWNGLSVGVREIPLSKCCSCIKISLSARMAAGTMNIISNLKGKVRTAILFEKMSLKILNPNTEN